MSNLVAELLSERGYLLADAAMGTDIILTNTFAANRHRLEFDKAEGRVGEINEAGVAGGSER